jgi:hypothetical protein
MSNVEDMKIRTLFPDDKSFSKILERFHSAADERGIPYEDVAVEAMHLWLGSDATTWVTPEEWAELALELERIRARNLRCRGLLVV